MFAQSLASTVLGSQAVPVVVEASISSGLPGIHVIGLRGSEGNDTRERVRCGLASLGIGFGDIRRCVVSIAPADLPKSGAALDLPIAIAILAALGHLPPDRVARIASHGELGLDGSLRAADGVVASAFAALRAGVEEFVVSTGSARRAALAPMRVTPAQSLREVVEHLRGKRVLVAADPTALAHAAIHDLNLADVRAQQAGVEAAEIAAAGGHNLLMFGTPGCGKTMLAQRLPTILPRLDPATALEVATIHDAAGLRERELDASPPFRAPHHTVTQQALVGGGGVRPIVGEVTLAHRGVLFLDELPEFRPSALDALRQPLEDREVRIRRAGWIARYPCRTQVVAAMNLCRCGRTGATGGAACTCTPTSRAAYLQRISGAIVDRFDIRVRMRLSGAIGESEPTRDSATAAARVRLARDRQLDRWDGQLNGEVDALDDARIQLQPDARTRLHRVARAAEGAQSNVQSSASREPLPTSTIATRSPQRTSSRPTTCVAAAPGVSSVHDPSRLPEAFLHVAPPARQLWLAGNPALLDRGRLRIGVIGSRHPRLDAADAARRIAHDAASAGLVIVSGLALGIDGIAHEAALDAGGATIGVLAGGLARVQPASNRQLAQRMAGSSTPRGVVAGPCSDAPGLVVSEYGAGDEEAHPYRFRERNRIIAALSDYLVVVQARHVSGSMITAEAALALGIQVGVLPSSPDDECHSGTTALIHDGADAVIDGASLFRRLELHGIVRPGFADAASRGAVIDPDVPGGWLGGDEPEQLQLEAHPLLVHMLVPRTAEEIACLAGIPLPDVRMQLLDLEDEHRARHADDGTWKRA